MSKKTAALLLAANCLLLAAAARLAASVPDITILIWSGRSSGDFNNIANWEASNPGALEAASPHRFMPRAPAPSTIALGERHAKLSGFAALGNYTFTGGPLVLGFYPLPNYGLNHFAGDNRIETSVSGDGHNHLGITQAAAGLLTITGDVSNGKNVGFVADGDVRVEGGVHSARSFTKSGSGQLSIAGKISGSPQPAHSRHVQAGTLVLNGLAEGGSAWLVDGSGAKAVTGLAGRGQLHNSPVTIGGADPAFPAFLAPGDPASTEGSSVLAVVNSPLTLRPSAVLRITINSVDNSRLVLTGTAASLTIEPGASLHLVGTLAPAATYVLASAPSITGAFTRATLNGKTLPAGWRIVIDAERILLTSTR
jgi:hypothetical protein